MGMIKSLDSVLVYLNDHSLWNQSQICNITCDVTHSFQNILVLCNTAIENWFLNICKYLISIVIWGHRIWNFYIIYWIFLFLTYETQPFFLSLKNLFIKKKKKKKKSKAGRHCLDPELLWLWHRSAAVALIQPLAWELLYAAPATLPKNNFFKNSEYG